jgi:tetratricopeptide (TPR) repeat protein
MDKVIKLINSSSGAKQVLGSDNAKAREYHEKAKALYRQAQNGTDKAEVSRLLNESVRAMYVAIRAASPASVFAEKHKRDFDKLQRSVDTFMEQHERISAEKGVDADGDALRSQVAMMSREAKRVYDLGQHEKGQTVLREAFDMLRGSIGSMRSGDTLVRSLNFANKEEEYNYELEKYKSQLVLVDVLLASKRESSEYIAKKVAEYIAVAEGERENGESQAAAGSFDEAVKSLERARKQIVRALRTGGIFVPG